MHPSTLIGKRVRVRTVRGDAEGVLVSVEDWGIAGGGNYLVLHVPDADGSEGPDRTIAFAMRSIESFEAIGHRT